MGTDKQYNAADEKAVKSCVTKEQLERLQELEDLKVILATAAGVRFFKRFFEEGRLFHTTFTGNSYTFFNEGARAFALKYFSDVCEAAPERLTELIVQNTEEDL